MGTHLPAVHSVHIYDQDLDLITRLRAIVSTGLRVDDAVLIVATEDHRTQLAKELDKTGVDVRAAVRNDRCLMLDAEEMLSTFMRNGSPDPELFQSGLGRTLAKASIRAERRGRRLTVFGEMVAVLWEQGKQKAALELEDIWNAALAQRSFHLHCAYPRFVFVREDELRSVCGVHSLVLQ